MPLCQIFTNRQSSLDFLLKRGVQTDDSVRETVAQIIENVCQRGDEGLLESARRFDSPALKALLVTGQELEDATVALEAEQAIQTATARVRSFHEAQMSALTKGWERKGGHFEWKEYDEHGGYRGQRLVPVKTAGIYVPGGKANYPSSVVMNCVPALAAGVKNVAICSPAGQDGNLSAAVLVAAREAGVTTLAKVGGAAAIAAFAFGTESVPKADVVAGPGNRFVNEAKRQLWGQVGLDLYAGPSEVCVLVDETSNPEYAAADWLTQVEHAEDNAGFLVSTSEAKLHEVIAAAERQLAAAPRSEIMRKALRDYGAVFLAEDVDAATDIVNRIAPEHLSISTKDQESIAAKIENAGCILLGEFTPESGGDYAIGPSHTLPTSTAARFAGPLNALTFLKVQSISCLTRDTLAELDHTIRDFGEIEGLPTHGNGSAIRFE